MACVKFRVEEGGGGGGIKNDFIYTSGRQVPTQYGQANA